MGDMMMQMALDKIDGGGKGKSGDKFEGGPLSDLLNLSGVTPYKRAEEEAPPPMMPPPAAVTQTRVSASGPMEEPASPMLPPPAITTIPLQDPGDTEALLAEMRARGLL